jgi:hypothetical protein
MALALVNFHAFPYAVTGVLVVGLTGVNTSNVKLSREGYFILRCLSMKPHSPKPEVRPCHCRIYCSIHAINFVSVRRFCQTPLLS